METIPPNPPQPNFMLQYSFVIVLIIIIVIITIILLCIKFSKKKRRSVIKPAEPANELPQEESPVKEPEPEPLLIHCPACGTEVSRYAPACLKCGHPIHSAVQAQQAPQAEVVFQKVCLCRRLQILQICKYSDSWFRTTRRGVWI